MRPRPGRRRFHGSAAMIASCWPIILFASLFTPSTASEQSRFEVRRPVLEGWDNSILFDPRPTPTPHAELRKRQFDLGGGTTSAKSSKATSSASEEERSTSSEIQAPSSTTGSPEATGEGGIVAAPSAMDSEIPKAFDGGLGTNYTDTKCSTFLRNMLSNDTFTNCIPVSLLLQNSQSFFTSSRSAKTLDPILTKSCQVNQRDCSAIMAAQALSLRSTAACSTDYDRQQPTVRQAYNGLVSYDLLYRATCMKATPSPANNNSAGFCYTNAVTNLSSPTDAYIYYIPLGVSLPAGSMPTCSQCLKQTMNSFGPVAKNRSQPISLTYSNAAQQVNLNCGPDFVNQSYVGASGKGAGAVVVPRLGAIVAAMAMMAFSQLLGIL